MNSISFLQTVLPMVMDRTIEKVEKECSDGTVKIYWAGAIVRIDIKPLVEVA